VRIAQNVDKRIETQISTVYATAELDDSGVWQDTNSNTYFDAFVWVKNVGSVRIIGIDKMDVFFGTDGNFERIPHESDAPASFPRWSYVIENNTEWINTATLRITIHYSSALASDTYMVKVITTTSISDTYYFSF
jgi:hypothetical protein